jgi:hypothetical protein
VLLESPQGEGDAPLGIRTKLRRNVGIHMVHGDFDRVFHE